MNKEEGEIIIYQPDDNVKLEVRLNEETVWLNRQQMASLFQRDVKTIGKHIANALTEELEGTPNYEYWKSRAKATRILVFCALGISLLSLIVVMLWADCICVEIPCIFAIISSVVFTVCVGMMAYLISLSNRLFRGI